MAPHLSFGTADGLTGPNRRQRTNRRRSAVTLIELLVVIAVIAILAGLVLPALLDEHADSINNGQFFMGPEGDYVVDLPASYHTGSGCFSASSDKCVFGLMEGTA